MTQSVFALMHPYPLHTIELGGKKKKSSAVKNSTGEKPPALNFDSSAFLMLLQVQGHSEIRCLKLS